MFVELFTIFALVFIHYAQKTPFFCDKSSKKACQGRLFSRFFEILRKIFEFFWKILKKRGFSPFFVFLGCTSRATNGRPYGFYDADELKRLAPWESCRRWATERAPYLVTLSSLRPIHTQNSSLLYTLYTHHTSRFLRRKRREASARGLKGMSG